MCVNTSRIKFCKNGEVQHLTVHMAVRLVSVHVLGRIERETDDGPWTFTRVDGVKGKGDHRLSAVHDGKYWEVLP